MPVTCKDLPVVEIPVFNPQATNGNKTPTPEGVLLTSADREANIRNLGALLVDPDVLYRLKVKGGDGTVGWVVEASVDSGKHVNIELDKNGGGYKKDIYTMVAKAGGEVAVRPLVLERCEGDRWVRERMAAYSIGFGKVAVGAKIANSRKEFRKEKEELIASIAAKRLPGWLINAEKAGSHLADLKLLRRLLAPTATIEGREYPTSAIINGHKIGALLFSNGSLVAGRMKFWQKLDEPGFVVTTAGDGKIPTILSLLSRMSLSADPIHDRWHTGPSDPFTVEAGTLVQADGEDFVLERGGLYRVRQIEDTQVTFSIAAHAKKPAASPMRIYERCQAEPMVLR